MQADTILRTLKWLYFGVLLAATAVGAWAIYPYAQEHRVARASPLAVHVYPHPFVSIIKDAKLAEPGSSIDSFFAPDVFSDAIAEIEQRKAAPLAKGADHDAWLREFASDLTASLNSYMARRYRDSFERLDVGNEAKGQVLVRIENVSDHPVEEVKVEVNGGQLFMDGSQSGVKLRSLGSRVLRIPAIGPGEKAELFALTTQEVATNGASPRVQVSAKDQIFPIVVHAEDAPRGLPLKTAGWIAFGTLYVTLILAGLFLKALSLAGLRFGVAKTGSKPPSATAAFAMVSVPAGAQPTTIAEPEAWQRPSSPG